MSAVKADSRGEMAAVDDILTRHIDSTVAIVQPLEQHDMALVKATHQLPAFDLETTKDLAVVVRQEDLTHTTTSRAVIPYSGTEQTTAVTIVPHTTSSRMPAITRIRRTHPLRKSVVMAMWALGILILGTAAFTATGMAASLAPRPFVAQAAQLGAGASGQQPLAPWSSSASSQNVLGIGGGAAPGVKAPGSAGLLAKVKNLTNPQPPSSSPPPTSIQPAPVSPWPPTDPYMYVPGHPSFAMNDPNGFYSWSFGQCTWWAQYERRDENLTNIGNAMYWAAGAAKRGYRVGSYPAAGATAVFQPGVEGAGGAGHVAHVVVVYPDGWFLVSEMNFYANGGGWGRVDYRFAHMGAGVSFIY